jgi:hypothetical protein
MHAPGPTALSPSRAPCHRQITTELKLREFSGERAPHLLSPVSSCSSNFSSPRQAQAAAEKCDAAIQGHPAVRRRAPTGPSLRAGLAGRRPVAHSKRPIGRGSISIPKGPDDGEGIRFGGRPIAPLSDRWAQLQTSPCRPPACPCVQLAPPHLVCVPLADVNPNCVSTSSNNGVSCWRRSMPWVCGARQPRKRSAPAAEATACLPPHADVRPGMGGHRRAIGA